MRSGHSKRNIFSMGPVGTHTHIPNAGSTTARKHTRLPAVLFDMMHDNNVTLVASVVAESPLLSSGDVLMPKVKLNAPPTVAAKM
jgi:hypothetical protein